MGGRVWGPSSWGRLMGGLGAGEGPLPARSVPSRSARGAPGSTQEAEPSSCLSRPRAPARAHPPAPQPGAESPWPPKRETNERVRWGEQGSEATDTWQLGEKALLPMRSQGYCGDGTGLSELHWVCFNGCGGGGAPRDSAGSGATEEGLTSRGGINIGMGRFLN